MDKPASRKKKTKKAIPKPKLKVKIEESNNNYFLLMPDLIRYLFIFLSVRSVLMLSATCKHYRRILQESEQCYKLANMYGGVIKDIFIKKRSKFPSNIHTLYYLLLPHLNNRQLEDNKIFDGYRICKRIGKYGTDERVREAFKSYGIAVCYGLWKKNRTSLIDELNLVSTEPKYYFVILDALINSNRNEKLKEILDNQTYIKSENSLAPLFISIKCRNIEAFKLLLTKIDTFDRSLISGEFIDLVRAIFKGELFELLSLITPYGVLDIYSFFPEGLIKTETQIDYILGDLSPNFSNVDTLTAVLCISVKPKVLSPNLLNYLLKKIEDKYNPLPIQKIISHCFSYHLGYSLEWMIKTGKMKITDIKWEEKLTMSSSCLNIMAKYKHPAILKNIEYIHSLYKYQACKELLLNYLINREGKIDNERKEALLKKYPSELMNKLLKEY